LSIKFLNARELRSEALIGTQGEMRQSYLRQVV